MKAIVFSRDRPMQLDLLLTSLERNAPDLFDVTVIWHAQEDEYVSGYGICMREHRADFWREDGLSYQVRSLLRDGGLVTFFTDDDVFYAPLHYGIGLHSEEICLSLRLGNNTTYCYPLARAQKTPGVPSWEWEQADGDFGYPMSLDGHIFRAEEILPLIANFSTPNHLEVMLMREAKQLGKPLMGSYEESLVVGIPANRVQSDMPNRNGETHPYSVRELNDRYLAGKRIDLDALDFSDIRGAHQEIPLVFR